MALARWQRTIVNSAGEPVPGANVRVEIEATGLPLATLYSDRAGTVGIGNPTTADSNGEVAFYCAGNPHKITITGNDVSQTLRYEPIGLAQETDGNVVGIPYRFNTDVMASDPGNGFLKFDNSSLASVSVVYLSGSDIHDNDVQSFLATISSGTLYIRTSDGDVFINATVTGAGTDQGDYYEFPVTVVNSGGTFLGGENVGFLSVTDGVDGVSSGINYTFDNNTTTTADPGTGDLRMNHASFASVTEIALDDNSSATGNPDISAFLATLDDSTATVKGVLSIAKAEQPQNFAQYQVTGITDATTHYRIAVTHVASNGSFTNADDLIINFSRTGDNGANGSNGTNGTNGSDGADGADGVSSGLPFTFDSNTTTSADPGTGDVRFNNGTIANVTEIAIDDNSAANGNPDVSAWVATFTESTNTSPYGQLIIKDFAAPENFAVFNITGITDATTHYRIAVTHVASNGSFTDTNPIVIEYYRTGDKGADGAGNGDVIGPVADAVVDDQIAVFDGVTGKLIRGGLGPEGSPQDPIRTSELFSKQGGASFSQYDGLAIDEDGKVYPVSSVLLGAIAVTFDGGGSAIEADAQYRIRVPFDCVITGWSLLADQSGFCVIDIWKDTYANYPPDNSDSITNGNEPTLYDEDKEVDTTLTGWTLEIAAGETLIFNVDSADTVEQVTLNLDIRKT